MVTAFTAKPIGSKALPCVNTRCQTCGMLVPAAFRDAVVTCGSCLYYEKLAEIVHRYLPKRLETKPW